MKQLLRLRSRALPLFLLCWLVAAIAPAWAQNLTVSGRVTDRGTGLGVPGATVLQKGSTNGASTNSDGTFSLAVPAGSKLVVSSIGYVSQELEVTSAGTTMNIGLAPDTKALSEVVVVAYGTQRRAAVTGAVSSVEGEVLENRPVTNVTQALQGTAPNLIIQQNSSEPGAPLNVNIRGVGTLGNASALVIVDGIPGSLDALNPNDIESISVLKDAASAAIYGSRAANGVLLVTTKKGRLDSKPRVSYNGIVGLQSPTLQQRPVSGLDYMQLKNEALANSGQPLQFSPAQMRAQAARGDQEWYLDEILKSRAPQQNHNLSLTGGTKTTSYLFSLGYFRQASLFEGDNYNVHRGNARLSLTNQVTDKLRVGVITAFARTGGREHAYFTEWLIGDAARIPRIYGIRDSLGRFVVPPSSGSNPLARLLNGGERTNQNDNFYGNLNAEYQLLKDLSVRGVLGGDLWNYRNHEFRRSLDYAPYAGGDNESSVQEKTQRTLLTNYQATLNYNHLFAEKHSVQALAGWSEERFTDEKSGIRRINIPGNDFGQINNGTQPGPISEDDVNYPAGVYGTETEWALASAFGRLSYAFADKYLLEGSFRYDGSSRFAKDNRWSFFPSVSAGWRVMEEPFMAGLKETVSELKLRGSWGKLGNQNIGLYRYLNTVRLVPIGYTFNNAGVPGAFFNIANRDITWETSTMKNVGVDVAFLGGRLGASFDYFDKETDNILIDLPVAGVFGVGNTGPTQNAAVVQNRGWEVAATWRSAPAGARGFNQSLTLNVADNLNEVKNTRGTEFGVNGGDRQSIIREGYPIGSYYGYKADGFFQNYEQTQSGPRPSFVANGDVRPGDIRYVDRNGDNIIDEKDRFVLGNPFPRYTFGATYTAGWQGFDLLVFVQGVGKRSLYLRGESVEAFHNNWDNVYQQHLDRWTPTNPDASYPRLTIGGASTNNNAGSDFWLQNAAYVRLKNVQLGYSLPTTLVQKAGLGKVRLYATGQNLWTWTKLDDIGFDPENSEFNNSLQTADGKVSSGRVYPTLKVWALGLDVQF